MHRHSSSSPLGCAYWRSGVHKMARPLAQTAQSHGSSATGTRLTVNIPASKLALTVKTIAISAAPYLAVIAFWQLLSELNLWHRVLFPSPSEVFLAFAQDLRSGVLLVDLAASLKSLAF